MTTERAAEMTGRGSRGKPKAGFPRLHTALGNRFAIPTFPQPRLRVIISIRKGGSPACPHSGFRLILRLENAGATYTVGGPL